MRARVLHHLEHLVSFDTQNPPRDIAPDTGIFAYLRRTLGPTFHCETVDLGDGCVSLFATRGTPGRLFNFHVDTVPAAAGFTGAPLQLRVAEDRAIGLGACDIKGAAAAMLAALEHTSGDVALLFTSDEEAGQSRCIKAFCALKKPFHIVFVAEPTQGRAVTSHRGIVTGTARFRGVSGHASSGNADRDSALHHAVRWSAAAMDLAARADDREVGGLTGIRFNLGRIEGGVKPNMIAADATVRFGFRPLPGEQDDAQFAAFAALAAPYEARVEPGFVAPSLPAPGRKPVPDALLADYGLEAAPAVDFWTEAALFSAAGYDTVVFGPGDIAQAHTADEWVAIDQLTSVADAYRAMLEP